MMGKTSILLLVFFAFIFNVARSQVTSYVFTSGTGIYTTISGTSPVLTGDGTDPLHDEGYANGIPLGFTFNYLGTDYTAIGASTNGFASFGTITTPGFSNSLSAGGTGRPILAPLWEDLSLPNTSSLQYITAGAAGSRVFILQWNNVLYDFGAGAASVSFQLRLYETTNVIEFIYNQLAGTVQDYSGGASIGITSASTGSGSFLSLNNTSAAPAVSSLVATNTIITRPNSGQVYTFTAPACIAPGNLSVTNITTSGATLNYTDATASGSEYAVTTEATPPSSGNFTSFSSTIIGGLLPGTQYYLHVRKNCSGAFSGWNSLAFATLCEASTVPYTMPISSVTAPALPLCTTVSDDNNDGNTWRTYPSAGQGWTDQVVAYVYNINCTTPANDWLFTKGLNLTAGNSYRLKFKYNNDATSLYTEKLKVAYGVSPASAAMTNILADYVSVYSITPKTVSIDFIPSFTGIGYIGFQAYSDANKDVLILDDISVNAAPACDIPMDLKATVQSTGTTVTVNWVAPATGSPSGYEYAVTTTDTPPASGTATTTASAVATGLISYAQYYLHVRSHCGVEFSDWVTLPFITVPNDEPCNAIALTAGGATICGNTTLATSLSDPEINCSTPNNSVWFKYTATATGTIVLHIATPASPANPLHGWVAWYTPTSDCPAMSFYEEGACSEFGKNGNNEVRELISPFLTQGNTYYIMIDGFSDDVGEFCISIPACSPAIDVKTEDIISTGANVSWTGTGTFILEYGPAGFTPGTGSVAGVGGTIISAAVSPQAITGLSLSTTHDVYVRQNCSAENSGYSNNSIATTFTTLGPPPPNDNCSGAVDLIIFDSICVGATAGTTLNAISSATIPLPACGNGSAGYDDDVWYSFTPVAGQQFVTIDFASTGGNTDVVAQIYTSSDNTSQGTFSLFSCSDDDGPAEMPGFFSLPVTAGTTYFMRVFSYGKGVNSQFTICITKALLINDNAAGAIELITNAGCTGAVFTNDGATQTAGERWGSCSATTGYATVWYKFVAPSGGAVRISTATGSGNTLTNTRMALFSTTDVNDYSSFTIISCDEDGGSGSFDNMSVLYATGLIAGNYYYIQVDKFDSAAATGTFCLTVDRLSTAMLSTANNCSSVYQAPVGSISSYTGWVPLMDDSSKLIAMVRNVTGSPVNAYSVVQNVKTGAVRQDVTSGEYYLNRNYTINNPTNGSGMVNVQFFFTSAELTALAAVDPAATIFRLRVTRQTATGCQADFVTANGANSELSQTGNGTTNGVSWVRVNTTGFSNFYIHSTRSRLTAKTFLQGAYSTGLSRHKDVTPVWATILNTYALGQPYNTIAFGNYAGTESVPAGFFTHTDANTDILDWVLVEIKNNSGTLITRRAAFIREDGQIVDLDGVSPIYLNGVSGNNNIFIRHRNHLGIRTSGTQTFTPLSLGNNPALSSYDFTTAQNKAFQNPAITTNAAMAQVSGVFMMWTGNANPDDYVRIITQVIPPIPSDAAYILGAILTGSPNLTVTGYSVGDINLDGNVRVTTQVLPPIPSDVSFILGTVLAGDFNATRREHK